MAETAIPQKSFLSHKVAHFTESVIREMTRQAMLHGAVNLSQGFPDFPAPAEIKRAAQDAIAADVNQYAITWGAKNLRNAIARQMERVARHCGRSRARDHGLLRLHRNHRLYFAGGVQCRRRGRDLRTVL